MPGDLGIGGSITCAKGLSLNPHASFATCPPLDDLLVPGGQGTRTEVGNARLLEFVSSRGGACQAVLSVCTGTFLLHAAGMDLTLAFIASLAGEEVAARVQFASEYDPSARRYGDLHTSHPAAPAYLRQV
jgi:transcriptional regulator GlxA family with amidase domain